MDIQLHSYFASTCEVCKTIWEKMTTEISNSFRLHSPLLLYYLRFILMLVWMDAIVNVLFF